MRIITIDMLYDYSSNFIHGGSKNCKFYVWLSMYMGVGDLNFI